MRKNVPITEVLKDPEQFARFFFGNEYDIFHLSQTIWLWFSGVLSRGVDFRPLT